MDISLIFKAALAGAVIVFASWLSGKKPELAGFIIALPLASILALAFGNLQHRDDTSSILFAKSILIGVPVSYLFFLPFFIPSVTRFGFWPSFVAGLALLAIGYFLHQFVMSKFS